MVFPVDMEFNGEIIFQAGKIYDMGDAPGWISRWEKRGGTRVEDLPPDNKDTP